MKNHVHTSLSRALIVMGAPFEWFVFEALFSVLTVNWFKAPLIIAPIVVILHIYGVFQTIHDPQWVKILIVRLRYFEKTGREKRFIT